MTIEGRVLLVCIALLTISVYISGFNIFVSLFVIAVSVILGARFKQFLLCLAIITPLAIMSIFTAPLGYVFKVNLAMFSILLSGIIPARMSTSEFCSALSYFIPERYSFYIALSIRMFHILKKDLKYSFESAKLEGGSKIKVYENALKTFVAVAVLRSVAIAESLYCRNFSGKVPKFYKKPDKRSVLSLIVSIFVFAFAILIRFSYSLPILPNLNFI